MQVVVLIHQENGRYGASFPDFPGCTTVAADPDAIMVKAAEVLCFHIDGMIEDGSELPAIRSLQELQDDPVFREDAEGAMIALVPCALAGRAVRLNITMDEALLARIDRAADRLGETRSGFLADAARRRLAADIAGAPEARARNHSKSA